MEHTFSDGHRVWKVDDLWKASADLPVIDLQVDLVVKDIGEEFECYWPIDHMVDFIRRVIDADLSFPIILTPDGRVADGRHRIFKAMVDGRSTIAARRLPVMPRPIEVIWTED